MKNEYEYLVMVNEQVIAEFHDWEHAVGTLDMIIDDLTKLGLENVIDYKIRDNRTSGIPEYFDS